MRRLEPLTRGQWWAVGLIGGAMVVPPGLVFAAVTMAFRDMNCVQFSMDPSDCPDALQAMIVTGGVCLAVLAALGAIFAIDRRARHV
ncbi:MAG: hypothetical protein IE922_12275 [Sphingomonadales bacterium]|nr:hypothetical protein [Sphingomonadales bacterium]